MIFQNVVENIPARELLLDNEFTAYYLSAQRLRQHKSSVEDDLYFRVRQNRLR